MKIRKITDKLPRVGTSIASGSGPSKISKSISSLNDVHKLNLGMISSTPIEFGTPSDTIFRANKSPDNNEWTSLLKSVATSGVVSLIGGGMLASGVNSLFAGSSEVFDKSDYSEPALNQFSLSDSQQQTMYVNQQGAFQNFSTISGSQTGEGLGVYNNQKSPLYKQSEIVQAIKNALLTCSSLNDVIAEI